MTGLKRLAGTSLSAVWRFGSNNPSKRTQVLMYHSIGGNAVGDQTGLYSVSPESFRAQMEMLKALERSRTLKVVPFGQFDPGAISITFDDGYVDNLTIVAPIMAELKLPFHVFICPMFVESAAPGFLTPEDIEMLLESREVSIGVHGYSHVPLTSLTTSEANAELNHSREWLANISSDCAPTMSYPHGAFDDRICKLVNEAGFGIAASSKFGPVKRSSNPYGIPRIDVWSTDTPSSVRAKICGQWDWMRWRT